MSNLEIEIILFVLCSYLGVKDYKRNTISIPMVIAGWILGGMFCPN